MSVATAVSVATELLRAWVTVMVPLASFDTTLPVAGVPLSSVTVAVSSTALGSLEPDPSTVMVSVALLVAPAASLIE